MPSPKHCSIPTIPLCHPATVARAVPLLAFLYIASCAGSAGTPAPERPTTANTRSTQGETRPETPRVPAKQSVVNLGNFSISLTVKDLATSREFYETLGFEMIAGVPEDKWILLKNGGARVGLFQGMFDDNLMTFNPTDARAIESVIKAAGYKLETATTGDSGPTSFIVKDPDGNTILVDQF